MTINELEEIFTPPIPKQILLDDLPVSALFYLDKNDSSNKGFEAKFYGLFKVLGKLGSSRISVIEHDKQIVNLEDGYHFSRDRTVVLVNP